MYSRRVIVIKLVFIGKEHMLSSELGNLGFEG